VLLFIQVLIVGQIITSTIGVSLGSGNRIFVQMKRVLDLFRLVNDGFSQV
jgi:hypothetical protein